MPVRPKSFSKPSLIRVFFSLITATLRIQYERATSVFISDFEMRRKNTQCLGINARTEREFLNSVDYFS